MKIQGKVNLAMCAAVLVGLACATAGAYTILGRNAIAESAHDATIVMESATATRKFTAAHISPLLADKLKIEFLPDAIPSFVAQSNARIVHDKLPEYNYREPTLNPTNMKDKAEGWEADIIDFFRKNPGKQQTQLIRNAVDGEFLTMARPIKVESRDCLTCHSTPEAAPPTLVALYGSEHGFGWHLGDIIGAQVVSIPLAVPRGRADRVLMAFVIGLAATFGLVILVVNLLLRLIVVKPVMQISGMATEVSLGSLDTPEIESKRKDEIGALTSSFNRMRRSLVSAMQMLEGNAAD